MASPGSRHRGSAARLDFLWGWPVPQLRFAPQWVRETSRLAALSRYIRGGREESYCGLNKDRIQNAIAITTDAHFNFAIA